MSAMNRVYYGSFCVLGLACTVACLRPPGSKWIRRGTSAKNSLSVSENRQGATIAPSDKENEIPSRYYLALMKVCKIAWANHTSGRQG